MKSSSMIAFPTKAIWHYTKYKTLVICCLFSHWALSNCYDPCWDSRHAPIIKTRVYPQINCWLLHWELHKNMSFRPLNNYSIHCIMSLSQKFYMPKRIVWAMLNKKKKRKMTMPKGMREKNACQRAWRKEKRKRKK